MSIKGSPVGGADARPAGGKGRKRGVSVAQRKRWQLGTAVSDSTAPRAPAARGSFDVRNGRPAGIDARRGSRGASPASQQEVPPPVGSPSAAQHPLPEPQLAWPAGSSPSNARPSAVDAEASAIMGNGAASPAASPAAPRAAEQSTAVPERRDREAQRQRLVADSARALDHSSSDASDALSDTSVYSTDLPAPWSSFRRGRGGASQQDQQQLQQPAAQAAQPGPDGRQASAAMTEAVARERQGVRAERGAGSRARFDRDDTMRRVREVELDPEAGGIRVDRSWKAVEGAALTDDLVLGKVLGSGFQAHVYELLDRDGRVAPVVLKASRRGALISDNKREWAVGQRLAALGPGGKTLPGLMKVGPAVCRGRKRSGSHGTKLVGMLLERINGQSVSKTITASDFHDIHYIREMLRQVFVALDAAQRAFGFHHYDLRLDNVMEHMPDSAQDARDPISQSMVGDAHARAHRGRSWKVIDFGLGRFDEHYAADEGADGDPGGDLPGDRRKAPWYLAPARCLGSAPEAIHQAAWRGKGDVYHLLFDISQKIHGRVWPQADRPCVRRLLSLIRHVCGVRPSATYYTSDAAVETEAVVQQCLPPVAQCFGVPAAERYGMRARRRKFVHKSYVLRWVLQLKAWQFPSNPGLTAAEVLTSPFFR